MASRLVVRAQASRRLRLALVGAAVLGLVASWGIFEWGRRAGGYDRFEAAGQRLELENRLAELTADNEALREEIVRVRTKARVEREAYGQVAGDLDELKAQVAELEEELAFYRGIMAPGDGGDGLKVRAVQVHPAGDPAHYRLRLVLVQAGRQGDRVRGRVGLRLEGADGDGPRRLEDGEVRVGEGELEYAFRYFQVLETELAVPEDFRPDRIEVVLDPARDRDPDIVESFLWRVTEG